jgi:hypothetical protein
MFIKIHFTIAIHSLYPLYPFGVGILLYSGTGSSSSLSLMAQ